MFAVAADAEFDIPVTDEEVPVDEVLTLFTLLDKNDINNYL
jgi:hypothetical protein